jgi:uncharacterized protein (TIGR02246 family)
MSGPSPYDTSDLPWCGDMPAEIEARGRSLEKIDGYVLKKANVIIERRRMIMKVLVSALLAVAVIIPPALADEREDAYAGVERWSAAFNSGDVEQLVRMYTDDALVLGTLSPGMISKPDDLRAYFKAAADAKLQVKLGDHSAVAVADDAVAIAGFYDFSRPAADGQPVVPARFSFVMVKKDGIWKIGHHHSSVRYERIFPPEAPASLHSRNRFHDE